MTNGAPSDEMSSNIETLLAGVPLHSCLTVQELRDRLAPFAAEMPVMLPCGEGGLFPLSAVRVTPVVLNVNLDPAFGPHEVPLEQDACDASALVLMPRQATG